MQRTAESAAHRNRHRPRAGGFHVRCPQVTYRDTIAACADQPIGKAVLNALDLLFQNDANLLAVNIAEQTIAARIAGYLQQNLPHYNVDVEYNRMGDVPKTVAWSDKPERVYPDIIVHRRRTSTNILAMELKKTSNPERKDDDLLKLAAYRRDLGYLYALFLRLGVGDIAGTVSECQWV